MKPTRTPTDIMEPESPSMMRHGKTLTIDVERYQRYLDHTDMSAAEREEFLRALWSIICNFVDLGFSVHPLQQACGEVENHAVSGAIGAPDAVKSGSTIESKFMESAAPEPVSAEEHYS